MSGRTEGPSLLGAYRGVIEELPGGAGQVKRLYYVDGLGKAVELEVSFPEPPAHSSEFSWGYAGSGPAETAWAIQHHYFGSFTGRGSDIPPERWSTMPEAILHQSFKEKFIVGLDQEAGFEIPCAQVAAWAVALGGPEATLLGVQLVLSESPHLSWKDREDIGVDVATRLGIEEDHSQATTISL